MLQRLTPITAEALIGRAIASFGEGRLAEVLEQLGAPAYLTDAHGRVTSFNTACIDFAGRTPVPGRDTWCVTWKLYTEEGQPMAHSECPMAMAIKEKRSVRGLLAFAERPDGTRVLFAPFPTPIHDDSGKLVGAVNLLIDITDRREAWRLRVEAQRCLRLALYIDDPATLEILKTMAAEYDQQADALEG